MKFMLTFAFAPEAKGGRDEAIARFKKTGGQPPKGVKRQPLDNQIQSADRAATLLPRTWSVASSS